MSTISTSPHPVQPSQNPITEASSMHKVAAITLAFWVMKVFATTLGETAGDFISMSLGLGYSVGLAITGVFLVIVLVAQIRAKALYPALFWTAIIATTTAGTEVSDLMDRTLGLGYVWGSVLLAAGLATTFVIWHRREGKINLAPIEGRRVEVLFWVAVLFSNSLGTAFGDFLTDVAGLTYIQGALITSGVIGVVLLLHYVTKINAVVLFWAAFIFTRPFGATFGDYLTKAPDLGGLALPRGYASLVTLGLLILVLVVSERKGRTV